MKRRQSLWIRLSRTCNLTCCSRSCRLPRRSLHVLGACSEVILLTASVCLLPACCACLGVLNYSEWGFYYQLQAVAKPLNLSDPLLTEWKQMEPLAMDLPPGGSHAQFRDPVTPWPMNKSLARQRMPNLVALLDQNTPLKPANTSDGSPATNADDGKTLWITTVGTLQQCVGGAALYVSEDLK